MITIIVHNRANKAILKNVLNLSVAPEQGLIIEFDTVENATKELEKLHKEKIEVKTIGQKVVSMDCTGFTAFQCMDRLGYMDRLRKEIADYRLMTYYPISESVLPVLLDGDGQSNRRKRREQERLKKEKQL